MSMHGFRRIAAAILTMAGMAAPLSAQNVTDADLAKGLSDPTKWLVVSGTYDGQRLSPLTQITRPTPASWLRSGRSRPESPVSSRRRRSS